MKLNLKKIKEIELEYQSSPISIITLQNLINMVASSSQDGAYLKTSAYKLALNTLQELGVIVESESKKIEQLNS